MKQLAKTAEVILNIKGETRDLEGKLGSAKSSAKDFGSTMQNIGGAVTSLGNGIGTVGKIITAGVTAPMIGLGVASAKTAIEFLSLKENAQTALTVMLGDSEKAKAYMDELLAFAKKTPFAFPDILQGGKNLVAFGMKTEQVVPLMTALGDAIAATGGNANDLNELNDIMGKIQAQGKITAVEIMQLSKKGIPVLQMFANQLGISVNEVQDKISKGAISAEEAFTMLEHGIENGTEGVAGSTAKMGGMMKELKKTWSGAIDSMKSAWRNASVEIFERSMPTFKRAVETITDIIKLLPKIFENVAQGFADVFAKAVDKIKGIVEALASMDPASQQAIGNFIAMIAIAGPLLMVLGKVITTIGGIISAIGAISASPIILAVSAIVAVVAGLGIAVGGTINDSKKHFSELGASAENAGQSMQRSFQKNIDSIKQIFAGIWKAISPVFENIKSGFEKAMTHILPAIAGLQEKASSAFKKIADALQPVFDAFNKMGEAMKPLTDAFSEWFGGKIAEGFERLGLLVEALGNGIAWLCEEAGKAMTMWSAIIEVVAGSLEKLLGIEKESGNAIDDLANSTRVFKTANGDLNTQIGAVADGLELGNKKLDEASKKYKATADGINKFGNDASVALIKMRTGFDIENSTQKFKDSIKNMALKSIEAINMLENDSISSLQRMAEKTGTSETEGHKQSLTRMQKYYDDKRNTVTVAEQRINEITADVQNQGGKMTLEQEQSLSRLRKQVSDNTITELSEAEQRLTAIRTAFAGENINSVISTNKEVLKNIKSNIAEVIAQRSLEHAENMASLELRFQTEPEKVREIIQAKLDEERRYKEELAGLQQEELNATVTSYGVVQTKYTEAQKGLTRIATLESKQRLTNEEASELKSLKTQETGWKNKADASKSAMDELGQDIVTFSDEQIAEAERVSGVTTDLGVSTYEEIGTSAETSKDDQVGFWDAIRDAGTQTGEAIKEWWSGFSEWIGEIWETVSTRASEIWEGIKTAISEKIEGAKTAVSTAIENIKIFFHNLGAIANNIWTNIQTAISTKIEGAKTAVNNAIEGIKSFFRNIWTTVSTVFANIHTTISEKIESAKTAVSDAVEGIKGFFDGIGATVERVFTGVKTTVENILSGIKLPELKFPEIKLPKIPGFAVGGHVAQDTLARVNEEGGELQVLKGGTTVIPHDLSKLLVGKMARGGAVNNSKSSIVNHININAQDKSTRQIENILYKAMKRSGI